MKRTQPANAEEEEVSGSAEGAEEGRTPTAGENFGFQPVEGSEADGVSDLEKPHHDETPEEKKERERLLTDISTIISRYPSIKPRSNMELINQLDQLDLRELRNVWQNAINDLQHIRGTPGSELLVRIITYLPDRTYLPGLQQRCLDHPELLSDVDALIVQKLGGYGLLQNIAFHVANIVAELQLGINDMARGERRARTAGAIQEPDSEESDSEVAIHREHRNNAKRSQKRRRQAGQENGQHARQES